MGSINPQGVYHYDHADQDATAADMLNRKANVEAAIGWTVLPLAVGIAVYQSQTPMYRVKSGRLELKGAVAKSAGTFGTTYTELTPTGAFPELPSLRSAYDSARILPSGAGTAPGRSYIDASGKMQIATTAGTASYYILTSEYPLT